MTKEIDPNRHARWMSGRVQADIHDLSIEGEIPEALEGIFCTVGPEPAFLPKPEYEHVIIDGDPMLSSVRIQKGKASYKSRYLETEKLTAQLAAGRNIFGTYRNPWTDEKIAEGIERETQNTTVYQRGDKCLVFKESMLPVEIDVHTLKRVGMPQYSQALPVNNMTAHETRCARTGEYFNIGNFVDGMGSNKYAVYYFNPEGELTRSEVFEGPYSCMMHDFAVTENYIVIPFFPSICDVERMKTAAGPVWEWQLDKACSVAIVPRKGGVQDIRWIPLDDTYFCIHFYNAYEEGDEIILDSVKESFNFLFPPLNQEPPPFSVNAARCRLNLVEGTATTSDIHKHVVELPRIDERYIGKKYTYGYSPMGTGPNPLGLPFYFDSVGRTNMDTKAVDIFYLDDHAHAQEFIFVPRHSDAAEGEGFLMGYVNYPLKNTTDFLIFDAEKIPQGPLATIHIPFSVNLKVHGNWFPS